MSLRPSRQILSLDRCPAQRQPASDWYPRADVLCECLTNPTGEGNTEMLSDRAVNSVLVMSLLLAACGGGKGTTSSTGTGGKGSATGGAMSTGTDMSSGSTMTTTAGSTTTASSSTGMPPSPCTLNLLETCKQLKACAPNLYMSLYENDDMLCQSEAVRLCSALPSPYDNENAGITDPAGCTLAISGSCDAFLTSLDSYHIPAPCRPKPGNQVLDKPCAFGGAPQCVSGLVCLGNGPDDCKNYCAPIGMIGRACGAAQGGPGNDNLCDPANHIHCVFAHEGNKVFQCLQVTYGKIGDPCVDGSDQACDSGLYCLNSTCAKRLSEGATCTLGATDPCDGRLGLSCKLTDPSMPSGGSTCQAPIVVPDGSLSGMVSDNGILHYHYCGNYSHPDPTTKICTRNAMLGEACTDYGCFMPYVCTGGTCQAPSVQPDATCTANPMPPVSALTCAISDGGIPFTCGAGQSCCLNPPMGVQVGYDFSTCSAAGFVCGPTAMASLACNDSAQCTGGQKCNLVFPKDGTFASACNNTSTYELCRMDNPSACGGAGCKANPGWVLASNVGFCTPPTCKEPGSQCASFSNCPCCSGSSHVPTGGLFPVCN